MKIPMNWPNRITIIRMLMIPVFLIFMSLEGTVFHWLAAAVFSFAAMTDMLDGALARSRNEVTDFGKFMDPIADKLLVLLPLMLLTAGNIYQVWAVMLMVAREVLVSGFRLVAAGKGIVIAAGWSGKIKTIVQMGTVVWVTLRFPLSTYVLWASAVLSLYSGMEIIIKNRVLLGESYDR